MDHKSIQLEKADRTHLEGYRRGEHLRKYGRTTVQDGATLRKETGIPIRLAAHSAREAVARMTPALALTFALLASLAQIVSILNWLQIGPHKLFNREWLKTLEVTLTKGRLAIISMLGLLSLGL